jgi:type I restriction enzyme M protein
MSDKKEPGSIGPEEVVRQKVIADLKALGWKENRLRWKPEWQVPDAPHDLTKRERGQKFKACGKADLVAFADDSGEPHALQVIFEFKEPTTEAGRQQLQRYLANEPVVRMGYWTNGTQSLAIYKSHSNEWIEVKNAPLPHPGDDLTAPPKNPPTWNDLRVPTEAQLSAALNRIVKTVVVTDTRSSRQEEWLRELLNVLLVKIESDNLASATANKTKPVKFRLYGDRATMVKVTANEIQEQFKEYFRRQQTRVFLPDDVDHIRLGDETIFAVVDALWPWRILGDKVDLLSKAFQVFRTQAMKSGEGQFLTPQRVIRPCVMAMEITAQDKVIDPACGSGGFLIEALRQVQEREFQTDPWRLVKYANDNLYGVDKDSLGVKLTKAVMIAMQDGSTHTLVGDAIRRHLWKSKFPELEQNLGRPGTEGELAEQFTVVLTNPPFGEDLKVSAADARASGYTITKAAASATRGGRKEHVDLEIGLVYLELAHRLLQMGGRVGIVLPETYFFSHKYRWLPGWLQGRFELRGMINIAMEAFEEFCRAKTNFYIFEKVGNGSEEVTATAPSASKPKKAGGKS